MAMRNWLLAAIALPHLAATTAASAAESGGAFIANPSVRLWYEETGRLSDNIAPPRDFQLWNTIIGEGAAEEQADDALFTVELRSDGQQNLAQPLTLRATDAKGKVLASRTVTNTLTGEAGRVVVPLWVRDVGCAGRVVFSAQFGASRRTVTLDFNCGE